MLLFHPDSTSWLGLCYDNVMVFEDTLNVLERTDNCTAMAYINRQGRVQSSLLLKLAESGLSYLANLVKILESSAVYQLLVLLSSLVLLESVGHPASEWMSSHMDLGQKSPYMPFPHFPHRRSCRVVHGCHLAPWYIYMACMMVTPPWGPISCSFPLICLVHASLYGSVIASFKPTGRQDMTPPLWPPTAC